MNKSNPKKDIPAKAHFIRYSEDLKENIINEIQTFESILSVSACASNAAMNSNSSPEISPQTKDENLKTINSKTSQELQKAKCLLRIQNILYCINEHLPK